MADHVNSGWVHGWMDYDRPWVTRTIAASLSGYKHTDGSTIGWRVTLHESDAERFSSALAVALSLVFPCFYIIVRRCILAGLPILYKGYRWLIKTLVPPPTKDRRHDDATELNWPGHHSTRAAFVETLESTGDEENPFHVVGKLLTGLRNVRPTEDTILAEVNKVFHEDIPSVFRRLNEDRKLAFSSLFVACLVLFLCGLGIYAGIEAASILTNNIAISRYGAGGPRYFYGVSLYQEAAAVKYRDQCYNSTIIKYRDDNWGSSANGSIVCDQFYQTSIAYTNTTNTSCPFDGNVCLQGPNAAFTLSTGWTDVTVLGINVPASSQMKFEKTKTCSPVSNDEPWVQFNPQGNGTWQYSYHEQTLDGNGGWQYDNEDCSEVNVPTFLTYTNEGDWSRYSSPVAGYSARYVTQGTPSE